MTRSPAAQLLWEWLQLELRVEESQSETPLLEVLKTCEQCDYSKPLTDYHKSGTTKDGYRLRCKLCIANPITEKVEPELDIPDSSIKCGTCWWGQACEHAWTKYKCLANAKECVPGYKNALYFPDPALRPTAELDRDERRDVQQKLDQWKHRS